VHACGALKTLAVSLVKIANDVRWLASGARCGLGEIVIPAHSPSSSIMPGKVNPTQCDAPLMVCGQVFGNDVAIAWGGAYGNFELNVCKPLLLHNLLQTVQLLAGGLRSFEQHGAAGIEPDRVRTNELLKRPPMRVRALWPHIGCDRPADIAQAANRDGSFLRQAALASGHVSAEQLGTLCPPCDGGRLTVLSCARSKENPSCRRIAAQPDLARLAQRVGLFAAEHGLGHHEQLGQFVFGHVPVVRVAHRYPNQGQIGVVDAAGKPSLGELRPQRLALGFVIDHLG